MRKRLLFMLSLTTVLFSCTKVMETDSQGEVAEVVTTKAGVKETVFTAYDFCNKECFWANLGPLEERIEATQIPAEKLSGYNTEELFILCLNNPLTLLYPAYNNELVAVDVVADRLNVFQALESREDAANAILDVYSDAVIDVEQKATNCLYRNGKYSFSLLSANFISLYIASARIPSLFEGENAARLKACAERLYEMKKANPEVFSWFSFSKELLLRDEIEINNGLNTDTAKQIYVRQHSPSPLTKSFDSDSYRQGNAYNPVFPRTKYGKEVYGIIFDELSDDERINIDSSIEVQYSSGAFLRETSSATYNCHSYAWNIIDNPFTYINCWINRSIDSWYLEENLEKYWTNDYYSEITNATFAAKIYYRYSDHSAISTGGSYYISKWGNGPVMEHLPECCPYLVSDMHFYAHLSGNTIEGGDNNGNDDEGDNNNDDSDNSGSDNGGHNGGGNHGGTIVIAPDFPSNPDLTIFADNTERLGSIVTYSTTISSNLTWKLFSAPLGGVEILIGSGAGSQYITSFDELGTYRLEVVCTVNGSVVGTGNRTIRITR